MNLSFLKNIKDFLFKKDIIIDIGSNQISFSPLHSENLYKEQALIAVEYHDSHKSIVAIGNDAKELFGKESENIKVVKPIKEGKIEDRLMAENLIKQILDKHNNENMLKLPPKILMIIPTKSSDVDMEQREAVITAVGCREFQIVNSLLASAIGMGGDIGNEKGVMVLDIGGENIQCGIVKLNKIITSKSFDYGISELDEMIIKKVREEYKVAIGFQTAENLKMTVGLNKEHSRIKVCGKDIIKNIPVEVEVDSSLISDVAELFFKRMLNIIKLVFEDMPEEISLDIKERGIMICGGGSQLKGLEENLLSELKLNVQIANSSFVSIEGARILWNNINNETIINYEE